MIKMWKKEILFSPTNDTRLFELIWWVVINKLGYKIDTKGNGGSANFNFIGSVG